MPSSVTNSERRQCLVGFLLITLGVTSLIMVALNKFPEKVKMKCLITHSLVIINSNACTYSNFSLFKCVLTSLKEALSVGRSVGNAFINHLRERIFCLCSARLVFFFFYIVRANEHDNMFS